MRVVLTYISAGLFLVFTACKKETLETLPPNPLLQVLQIDGEYFARNVQEFPDGSLLISAVSENNGPAVIGRYTASGDLLWQIELPNVIQKLWRTIVLANGTIAAVGFGKGNDADECGIVILSEDGEVLKEYKYFNFSDDVNAADCIQLSNGNLAVLTNGGRLVIFNEQLNLIHDKVHGGGYQGTLQEGNSGELFLQSYDPEFSSGDPNVFTSIIKLSADAYDVIYHQKVFYPVPLSPSNVAISNDGKAVVAAARFSTNRDNISTEFQASGQEEYLIGPTIIVSISDGIYANTKQVELTGYPKNGCITKVKRCRDGGYIMVGTCNINTNQSVHSEYRVLLIKLSQDLQMEWMQIPNTNSAAIGDDVQETSTGYLVCATHLSLNEVLRPMMFKTDIKGIIN